MLRKKKRKTIKSEDSLSIRIIDRRKRPDGAIKRFPPAPREVADAALSGATWQHVRLAGEESVSIISASIF